jgi:hypothetical protein
MCAPHTADRDEPAYSLPSRPPYRFTARCDIASSADTSYYDLVSYCAASGQALTHQGRDSSMLDAIGPMGFLVSLLRDSRGRAVTAPGSGEARFVDITRESTPRTNAQPRAERSGVLCQRCLHANIMVGSDGPTRGVECSARVP